LSLFVLLAVEKGGRERERERERDDDDDVDGVFG